MHEPRAAHKPPLVFSTGHRRSREPPDLSHMPSDDHYDARFHGENWSGRAMQGATFEQCSFERCDLSRADLAKCRFIDCAFTACDLTMVKLRGAGLQDVRFEECKVLGVDFSACNPMLLQVTFDRCRLDHSVMVGMKLKGTRFDHCTMHGVDFSTTELEEAVFPGCDLLNAVFERTSLRKVDLTTATNFRINPSSNDLRGARFSVHGAIALLEPFGVEVE